MSNDDRDRWNERYRQGSHARGEPSKVLEGLAPRLPTAGRALDLAGGAGRNALWLARRGLLTTIADVASVGLSIAAERARAGGLALTTLERDLEVEGLPVGPWDLVLSVLYLDRDVLAAVPAELAPGGVLVVIQPTRVNLERHPRPPARFLLAPGELPSLVPGLDVLHHEEGWLADGRHDAVLVARRRSQG